MLIYENKTKRYTVSRCLSVIVVKPVTRIRSYPGFAMYQFYYPAVQSLVIADGVYKEDVNSIDKTLMKKTSLIEL
jgi:hypothetical protein